MRLTPLTAEYAAAAGRLYTDSFPPEERRPWGEILSPASSQGPHAEAIIVDDAFAGLVTTWDLGRWIYVEHLAVDPSLRGRGTGAALLSLLRSRSGRPVVLEVEPPAADNPMAERRIGFYARNGFSVLDYDYIQPPYSPGLPSVPLLLMSTDPDDDAAGIARALHREVYKVLS